MPIIISCVGLYTIVIGHDMQVIRNSSYAVVMAAVADCVCVPIVCEFPQALFN